MSKSEEPSDPDPILFRRINHELEQRVAARTASLEVANRELEAFAYSVAHELRRPLAPMLSAVQLMQRAPQTAEALRQPLEIIRRDIDAEARLIEDLLAFSRASKEALRKERIDQAAMVRDVLQALRGEQLGRHIDLGIGELPAADADPRLLKQVWLNLIANALKYTRSRTAAVIRVGADQGDGVPAYYVADNGIGFDMSERDRLFGVFQRLHPAEEYEGTGIGLAIVQRIIDRHGGRIWTQAERDCGATFTLQA